MWEMKLRAWAAGAFMATAAVGSSGYFIAHTGAAQPGDGPGTAASDKPAAEKPAAQKPAGENLSDPLARTKRLRELITQILQASEAVDRLRREILKRRQNRDESPNNLKQQWDQANAALKDAKQKFDRIAALGPMTWDKPFPTDPDVRTQAQRAMADAVFRYWQDWDNNRNQPNSVAAIRAEAELKFAEMELAAFRAATKSAQPAARGPVPPVSPELRKLREEKLKAAKEALELALKIQAVTPGPATSDGAQSEGDFIYDWSLRVVETEREIDPSAASWVKAAREHLDRMKALEKKQAERVKAGVARRTAASAAKFYRLEAEIWLKEAETARPRADAGADEFDRLKQLLDTEQRRLEQLRKNSAKRATELQDDRSPNRLGLAPIPGYLQPKLPTNFRDSIIRRDGDLIVFEPGLDAGVQKGMKLRVQRPGAKGKQLSMVTVLLADPKRAVGRFTPASGGKLPDDYPKPGDELRPE